ncbi:MAG: acyl-CoA dehydrogenase family protein [Acidimicrobiales bacterium]
MDLALPEVATQFAAATDRAIAQAGGIELARRAEADPTLRAGEVKDILDALGVPDLDPRSDLESAAMAAELVRVAGRSVVPFPVVGYLMARPPDGTPSALASAYPLRVDHGDLFEQWLVHDFDGGVALARPTTPLRGSLLAPFTADLESEHPPEPAGADEDVRLLCVLWSSYLLGVGEYALELAVDHVKSRVQFGRPLSELQSVRFQIADATVALDGLRELVHFALWRGSAYPQSAQTDALATRFQAQEVIQPLLRTCQQLHGASGLCDEYDISVLVRHTQPALRLPVDSDAMSGILFEAIQRQGFDTLFPLRAVDGTLREIA